MGESGLEMPNVWNHAHCAKKWISHWWASKFIASTAASVTTIAGFLFSTPVCCGKRYKAHQVGDKSLDCGWTRCEALGKTHGFRALLSTFIEVTNPWVFFFPFPFLMVVK